MSIQRVIVFETKGKQFPNLRKAIEYREGLIDDFFQHTPGFESVRAKDRVAFIESILERRQALISLLDYGASIPAEDVDDDDDEPPKPVSQVDRMNQIARNWDKQPDANK